MNVLRYLLTCIIAGCFAWVLIADEAPKPGMKEYVRKCAICEGKGWRLLTPPDKGQFAGRIESRRHWDVKATCPICSGKGRTRMTRTFVRILDEEGKPCPKCGWAGATVCRKCKGQGFVPCRYRGCDHGWLIRKTGKRISGNREAPPEVLPCPSCHGFEQVPCVECSGHGGIPCRKCQGSGYDPKAPRPEKAPAIDKEPAPPAEPPAKK